MSKEAMKLALDKVQEFKSRWCKVPPFADRVNKATREAITLAQVPIFELEHVLQKALAEQPAQTDWEAVAADQALTIALLKAEQPAQGCDYCNHPQYAGTKCKNCGREQPEQQQQQQEPVATLWQHSETGRTRITMLGDITDCDARWFKAADLYTSPPVAQQKPVALPEKIYEFVPTPEPAKWHHPECEGECIACLIERVVQEAYGSQGLSYLQRHLTSPPAQRKPLTDEQRKEIAKGWRGRNWTVGDIIDAIEAAHGITGATK